MIMHHQPASRALTVPWSALSWRGAAALIATAAGTVIVTGALLPWAEKSAAHVQASGAQGGNGRILAVAGVIVIAAGIWQLAAGGHAGRWLAGLAGFAAAGLSGYLLIQLTGSTTVLGGGSAVITRGGPGLPVVLAGSVAAFATLLFPRSAY